MALPHLLTIMEYVRKQDSLKKKLGGFSLWTMSKQSFLRTTTESCTRNSTATEDTDGSLSMLFVTMFSCRDDAEEIDDFVSDIYLWPFQPVLKKFGSDTWYINF